MSIEQQQEHPESVDELSIDEQLDSAIAHDPSNIK